MSGSDSNIPNPDQIQIHIPTPTPSAPPVAPPSGSSTPPHRGEVLFTAVAVMITALDQLNKFLGTMSVSILQGDLNKDVYYANQLSHIHFKTMPTGTSATAKRQKASISAYNQNLQSKQGLIQANLKAHQSQEQMDIQDATSTSTNSQQLTGIIQSIFQLATQVLGSVLSASH